MTLTDHLSAIQRNSPHARAAFCAEIGADPALRAQAEARLAALVPALCDKDHVSRVHRAALQEALKDE